MPFYNYFTGNGYYIPNAPEQGINVAISRQKSRDQRGRKRKTSARFATAWLDHGVNPTDKGYEYTIHVNKPLSTVQVSDRFVGLGLVPSLWPLDFTENKK